MLFFAFILIEIIYGLKYSVNLLKFFFRVLKLIYIVHIIQLIFLFK